MGTTPEERRGDAPRPPLRRRGGARTATVVVADPDVARRPAHPPRTARRAGHLPRRASGARPWRWRSGPPASWWSRTRARRRSSVVAPDGRCRALGGGPARAAHRRSPCRREVVVADPPRHEVVVLSLAGAVGRAGAGPATGRRAQLPDRARARPPDGTLLVVDALNFRVVRIAADGRLARALRRARRRGSGASPARRASRGLGRARLRVRRAARRRARLRRRRPFEYAVGRERCGARASSAPRRPRGRRRRSALRRGQPEPAGSRSSRSWEAPHERDDARSPSSSGPAPPRGAARARRLEARPLRHRARGRSGRCRRRTPASSATSRTRHRRARCSNRPRPGPRTTSRTRAPPSRRAPARRPGRAGSASRATTGRSRWGRRCARNIRMTRDDRSRPGAASNLGTDLRSSHPVSMRAGAGAGARAPPRATRSSSTRRRRPVHLLPRPARRSGATRSRSASSS